MKRIPAVLPGLLLLPFVGIATADEPTPGVKTSSVAVKEGTWTNVTELVEKNVGKVVIVDLWSTSCLPCIEEFPNLVKLQKQYPEKVVCISLNLDYAGIRSKPPTYYRPRVEKFLQKQKAEFSNFLCTTEAIEVMDALEILSIPAVFVYDKDGKLAKRFDESMLQDGEEESFTYRKDVNPLVEKLLK